MLPPGVLTLYNVPTVELELVSIALDKPCTLGP